MSENSEFKKQVVSDEDWLTARQRLLEKEKQFTKLRDELSQQRRDMPWRKINQDYLFETEDGTKSLTELFAGKSQLMVYHFMFGPDWEEGCPSCSFWADNFNPIVTHLNQRDIHLVAVSRASLDKLQNYRKRMGWSFDWVSSFSNSFNSDFNVSFSQQEIDSGQAVYNYRPSQFPSSEAPGISVFVKNDRGEVFHTYSCYARGLDMLNGAYHLMDLVPKGRDEQDLPYTMAWVKRHDCYD